MCFTQEAMLSGIHSKQALQTVQHLMPGALKAIQGNGQSCIELMTFSVQYFSRCIKWLCEVWKTKEYSPEYAI